MTTPTMRLLLLSVAAGIGAGLLLGQGGVPIWQAIIGGCAAFGGAFYFLDKITH
jgi:hypothetical protein